LQASNLNKWASPKYSRHKSLKTHYYILLTR
jgi:hypothetical protein